MGSFKSSRCGKIKFQSRAKSSGTGVGGRCCRLLLQSWGIPMKNLAKLALAAALTIGICSGGAMAQSVGNTDPAKADTTNPNSTPKAKTMKKVQKSAHVKMKKHHKSM
jgi:hypothetical protein